MVVTEEAGSAHLVGDNVGLNDALEQASGLEEGAAELAAEAASTSCLQTYENNVVT